MMWSALKRLITARNATTGALLYLGMRWFDRLLGLVSTVVLARLLTPDDFGVIALATTAIGLASVLLDMGINIALVQKSSLSKGDIDTAWTLRLIQEGTLALLIALSAPLVARYFDEDRLASVLVFLAIAQGVQALQGMGPILLQKEMRFAREVAFFMGRRLITFLITLTLAVWLHNYWALVIGTLSGSLVGVILSYAVYPLMPSLSLQSWRVFMGSSIWLMLRSLSGYSSEQIDKLLIGKRDGVNVLGAYSIADQIAQMPSSELIAPMARALLPAYSKIKDDVAALRAMFLRALGVQATIAIPAGIGLALVSHEAADVILGPTWLSAAPFISVLACVYSLYALSNSSSYLLLATGRFRAVGLIQIVPLIGLVLIAFVVMPHISGLDIARARLLVSIAPVMLYMWLAINGLGRGTGREVALTLMRPITGVLLMAGALQWLDAALPPLQSMAMLAIKVVCGVFVYAFSVAGLWVLQRRPAGAEQWLLDMVRRALARNGQS